MGPVENWMVKEKGQMANSPPSQRWDGVEVRVDDRVWHPRRWGRKGQRFIG